MPSKSLNPRLLVIIVSWSQQTLVHYKPSLIIRMPFKSVKWALNGSNLPIPHKNFLLDAIEFCLAKNYFWYDNKFFLQILGVAMGACFASVENVFMALWEEETIFNNRSTQLKCYFRYIDYLIIIWEGNMTSLQMFMSKLNGNTIFFLKPQTEMVIYP